MPNSENMNPIMGLMIVYWIIAMLGAYYLVKKGKMTKNKQKAILFTTIIVAGLLLGSYPNPMSPIQTIFITISKNDPVIKILPMILILSLLAISNIIIGRMFCGYACPLGAVQELLSKFKFKHEMKEQRKVKNKIVLNNSQTRIIRTIVFFSIIIIALLFPAPVSSAINPFLGFQLLYSFLLIPTILLLLISVLSIFIYRPWCRIFCPFGFIADIFAKFSLTKYTRNSNCTNCKLCEKICPTEEAYSESKKGECYVCNRCTDTCPHEALDFQ